MLKLSCVFCLVNGALYFLLDASEVACDVTVFIDEPGWLFCFFRESLPLINSLICMMVCLFLVWAWLCSVSSSLLIEEFWEFWYIESSLACDPPSPWISMVDFFSSSGLTSTSFYGEISLKSRLICGVDWPLFSLVSSCRPGLASSSVNTAPRWCVGWPLISLDFTFVLLMSCLYCMSDVLMERSTLLLKLTLVTWNLWPTLLL